MAQVAQPGVVGAPSAASEPPPSVAGPLGGEEASGDDESSSLDEGPVSEVVASVETLLDGAPSLPDEGATLPDGTAPLVAAEAS